MVKPKFCSSCGNSFNGNKQEIKKSKIVMDVDIEDQNEDLEDYENKASIESIKKIRNLDYEINTSKKIKETIGDLVGTSNNIEEIYNNDNIPQKKLSRKEFLEQFSKEAGSLRGKNKTRKRDA
jgi:hypothetical protein